MTKARKSKDPGALLKVGGRFIHSGDFLGFSARIICSTSGRRKKETGVGQVRPFLYTAKNINC